MARLRQWMAGAFVLLSAIAIVNASYVVRDALPSASQRNVTLLYVGADDCAPCRSWRRGAGAAFRSSPEFPRISYREVEAATVLNLLNDEYWPSDLREYRSRLGRGAGVPLWFVIADREIVETAFGESQWKSLVLPKLKTLLP